MTSTRGLMCVCLYRSADLFSSVMRRAVHGMPNVIREMEFIAGLMKARQVVIPERMPMTILNLDLVTWEGNGLTRGVNKRKVQNVVNFDPNVYACGYASAPVSAEYLGQISLGKPHADGTHEHPQYGQLIQHLPQKAQRRVEVSGADT